MKTKPENIEQYWVSQDRSSLHKLYELLISF